MSQTIGFDLDMTLVDTAEGIVASIGHVLALHGAHADDADLRATVGLPLDQVFPRWISGVPHEQLRTEFRLHNMEVAVPLTCALPGAAEALKSVADHGLGVVVVTAKLVDHAWAVLAAAGLDAHVGVVVGDRFGAAKGVALREHRASAYVGDHPGDVAAARAADCTSVVVPTGAASVADLRSAGADVVLASLTEFPWWLRDRVGG